MPHFVLKAYPSYSRGTGDDGSIARAAFFFSAPESTRIRQKKMSKDCFLISIRK